RRPEHAPRGRRTRHLRALQLLAHLGQAHIEGEGRRRRWWHVGAADQGGTHRGEGKEKGVAATNPPGSLPTTTTPLSPGDAQVADASMRGEARRRPPQRVASMRGEAAPLAERPAER